MKIAIDFDRTITTDPELWMSFANAARQRGHEVTIVTSRSPDLPCFAGECGFPIIYCSFTAKRKHYQADIWIDDDPVHIDRDHGTYS